MDSQDGSQSEKGAYFLSDLHLFSNRSIGDRYREELFAKTAQAHTLVLGGDIFDFKWSRYGGEKITSDHAVTWLRELIAINPRCQFHFLLGNHDSNPTFVQRLTELATAERSFCWHRYFVRLGECLCLHGDVADGTLRHDALDECRRRIEGTHRSHPIWKLAYDVAIGLQLHRLFLRTIRPMKVVARVERYAQQINQASDAGVTDVYFGHTHRPIDGLEYAELRFHNGGAAIKGLSFEILDMNLNETE